MPDALEHDLELANLVGGRRDLGGERLSVVDPCTSEPFASAPDSGAREVAGALNAAVEAFRGWSRVTPAVRAAALLDAAAVLEARAPRLISAEVRDTGKPVRQMSEDELPAILDQIRFFAGGARLLSGLAAAEYLPGCTSMVRREPLGVCVGITPWNYPLMMAVWKWAPAIAAGNTVVIKPSELTPVATVLMAEQLAEVLPPGVLNVVCGGAGTGALLASDPRVALVSLTGSQRAGRAVAAAAAQRLGRVHLELGGNAPVLVFADADLEAAASAITAAAYYNAGQDCTAAARVIAEASIYDELVDALGAAASELRPGPPSDVTASFGPLIARRQLERVEELLATVKRPAAVVAGGQRVDVPGWFFEATVVAGVDQKDRIVQEEIFGPVFTVQTVKSEVQAIACANDVDQGLTASVFTTDHARAMRCSVALDFGAVSVNGHAPMSSELPHGGFKGSGYDKTSPCTASRTTPGSSTSRTSSDQSARRRSSRRAALLRGRPRVAVGRRRRADGLNEKPSRLAAMVIAI
jgi:betaine-aldehyde dehydrogenase